jgi:ssDNA-binding Zn-finger/Zn-ribbon topoisomerase 1
MMNRPENVSELRSFPLPKPSGEKCPKCGAALVVYHRITGVYIGCSAYPECKYIEGGTRRPVRLKGKG